MSRERVLTPFQVESERGRDVVTGMLESNPPLRGRLTRMLKDFTSLPGRQEMFFGMATDGLVVGARRDTLFWAQSESPGIDIIVVTADVNGKQPEDIHETYTGFPSRTLRYYKDGGLLLPSHDLIRQFYSGERVSLDYGYIQKLYKQIGQVYIPSVDRPEDIVALVGSRRSVYSISSLLENNNE